MTQPSSTAMAGPTGARPIGANPVGTNPSPLLFDPASNAERGRPEWPAAADVVSLRSVAELENLGADHHPDVVLLELPAGHVEDELPRINELARRCGVLVLSTSQNARAMFATLLDCARSLPETPRPAERETGGVNEPDQPAGGAVLTAREAEALRYLAAGYTHAQAATRMGISIWTFETYLRRVRSKYGGANTAGLIRLALSLEGAQPPVREATPADPARPA